MKPPLRYIQVGTGGWGGSWCGNVLPRLAELGKAVAGTGEPIFPFASDLAAADSKQRAQCSFSGESLIRSAH